MKRCVENALAMKIHELDHAKTAENSWLRLAAFLDETGKHENEVHDVVDTVEWARYVQLKLSS